MTQGRKLILTIFFHWIFENHNRITFLDNFHCYVRGSTKKDKSEIKVSFSRPNGVYKHRKTTRVKGFLVRGRAKQLLEEIQREKNGQIP